jgi:hypothetical protein
VLITVRNETTRFSSRRERDIENLLVSLPIPQLKKRTAHTHAHTQTHTHRATARRYALQLQSLLRRELADTTVKEEHNTHTHTHTNTHTPFPFYTCSQNTLDVSAVIETSLPEKCVGTICSSFFFRSCNWNKSTIQFIMESQIKCRLFEKVAVLNLLLSSFCW